MASQISNSNTLSSPPEGGRIPSLDGLRAVAILLVILFHLARTNDFAGHQLIYWFASMGGVGVDVFFAISGFLITTLLLRELNRTGAISLTGFFSRRVVRILPAFVTYLAAMAILSRAGWIRLQPRDWAAALTYTVDFFIHSVSFPLGHIWSLSVEEHFYLVWPVLFVMLGARRAAGAALACLLAEPIVRWFTYRYGGAYFDIDYVTFTRLDAIAVGCLLATAGQLATGHALLNRLDRKPARSFLAALIMLVASCFLLGQIGKYTIVAKPFVNALAIGIMIWIAARFPATSFGRLLNWSPLAWLGRLSYSLYLWQQVFLDPTNGQRWICRFPQNLGLALAAAVASHYLVELPFLNLKKSKLVARRERTQAFHSPLSSAGLQRA